VGDAAIPILREMKLSQLTLDGSEITFDGLRKLAGHPTLRKVTVAHLGLTGDEVQQLRDLLPNCQIQADRR
jgi:hypothetical protein